MISNGEETQATAHLSKFFSQLKVEKKAIIATLVNDNPRRVVVNNDATNEDSSSSRTAVRTISITLPCHESPISPPVRRPSFPSRGGVKESPRVGSTTPSLSVPRYHCDIASRRISRWHSASSTRRPTILTSQIVLSSALFALDDSKEKKQIPPSKPPARPATATTTTADGAPPPRRQISASRSWDNFFFHDLVGLNHQSRKKNNATVSPPLPQRKERWGEPSTDRTAHHPRSQTLDESSSTSSFCF